MEKTTDQMKLYYSPGACSLAAHITFQETGLPCSLEKVDLKNHEIGGKSYYDVNPKGSVPAVKLKSGEVLTEAAVVLQYLADQKPEKKLISQEGMERYRTQEWLNFIATDLHKSFSPLFNPKTPVEYKTMAKETIGKKLKVFEEQLKNSDYLVGSSATVADIYLFTILRWTKKNEISLDAYPGITKFVKRMEARPAVQAAIKQEELQ